MMKVVEVIKTDETDPVVLEKGLKWVEEIGKVSVLCAGNSRTVSSREEKNSGHCMYNHNYILFLKL